jgi:hypothetical protein
LPPDQRRIIEEAVVVVTLGYLASLAVACWHILVHSLTTPSGLMVIAAFVIAGSILAAIVRCGERASAFASNSPPVRLMAQRMDCQAVVVLRQFDPDAPGRARPRAPGAVPAAA